MSITRGLRIGAVSDALEAVVQEGERLATIAPSFDDSAECGGYMLALSDSMQECALSSGDPDICAAIACELDHSLFVSSGGMDNRLQEQELAVDYDFDLAIAQEAAILYCEDSQELMNMTLSEAIDYYRMDAVIH